MNFARAGISVFFCTAFARIRRLRESPHFFWYFYRENYQSPQNFRKSLADQCQNPGSRNSPGDPTGSSSRPAATPRPASSPAPSGSWRSSGGSTCLTLLV